MNTQQAKQRFGIIGNDLQLNRAIDIALQVAPTEISVLITGESGTGKENIPKIIHQNSRRKHNKYIAVNCGAIPEGTIDSELFGHEKGSFTGAHENRKGYFEFADKGTIFLDEVGELPLSSQARLLRVLENGEYIKVGSSKIQKTDVRIIAATNVNIQEAVKKGKFREDLFYRLNTLSIQLPPLRDRKEDIYLLFLKFASDFADEYKTPPIQLNEEAKKILQNYSWPGNIRQLKNFVAQLSVIEKERIINIHAIEAILPKIKHNSPILFEDKSKADLSEREILYKVLFDMKKIFYAPEAYPSSSKHIMDVYTPSNDIEDNRPLILYLHGGSFYAGSKDLVDCQDFCTNMARRGYVTASLNYRLSSPTLFLLSATEQYQTVLEAVSDIKAAIRFFRKDYATNNNSFGIDPNTIFIGGYSAGAVLAIHLAYIDNISDLPISPVNVQGLVNSIGGDLEGDGGNYGYSSECQGVISFAGGINDVSWIDNNDEPLVSVQGTADLTVNYNCGPGQNIPSVLTLCGSGEMHQQADNMGLINDKLIFS